MGIVTLVFKICQPICDDKPNDNGDMRELPFKEKLGR